MRAQAFPLALKRDLLKILSTPSTSGRRLSVGRRQRDETRELADLLIDLEDRRLALDVMEALKGSLE